MVPKFVNIIKRKWKSHLVVLNVDKKRLFIADSSIGKRRPMSAGRYRGAAVDGIARTTNSVEGWHHGLQSLFQCQHPTMWTFFQGLQRDMQRQKTSFMQRVTGLEHPSRKRYRALEVRVERAVAAYGRADILLYLRALAHLS